MRADVVGAYELSRTLSMPFGPCVCAGSVPSVLAGGALGGIFIHSFMERPSQTIRKKIMPRSDGRRVDLSDLGVPHSGAGAPITLTTTLILDW